MKKFQAVSALIEDGTGIVLEKRIVNFQGMSFADAAKTAGVAIEVYNEIAYGGTHWELYSVMYMGDVR